MAGIGGLFNALSGAITAGNISNAMGAASALQGALGTSVATVQQAQIYLNQYQMAQAMNNPNSVPMMNAAVAGLTQMIGALPSGDGPLIAELGNPAIMQNPGQAADVISRIQASLVQHNFL